jgi:hypothetical protein
MANLLHLKQGLCQARALTAFIMASARLAVSLCLLIRLSAGSIDEGVFDRQLCEADLEKELDWKDLARVANHTRRESASAAAPAFRGCMLTQVTDPIGSFGKLQFAVMAAFAQRWGHVPLVEAELDCDGCTPTQPTPPGYDIRFGKVPWLLKWLRSGECDWLFWMDADVFVLDHGRDWLSDLVARHGDAPALHLVAASAPEMDIMNTGTMLLRCDGWTEASRNAVTH